MHLHLVNKSVTIFKVILIVDIFSSQFDSQFDPYITYCMEEANCLKYFKEKMAENEDFKTYILVSSYAFFFFHVSFIDIYIL